MSTMQTAIWLYGLTKTFADKRKRLERYIPLVRMAMERGLLNKSLFYDTLGIDKVGDRSLWENINAVSAATFHAAERINRQTDDVRSGTAKDAKSRRGTGRSGA